MNIIFYCFVLWKVGLWKAEAEMAYRDWKYDSKVCLWEFLTNWIRSMEAFQRKVLLLRSYSGSWNLCCSKDFQGL